ncbi:MAG: hypothetical protein ABIP63_08385 [Thermoanaerobaculia bacterium]
MKPARHTDLALPYVLSVPSGKADSEPMPLVIFMHGRGADASDLADLAPMIDAAGIDAAGIDGAGTDGPGGYRFVFPNAARPFEAYPGMTFGFSWFDGWPPEGDSIVQSRRSMLTLIDQLIARYPTSGKVVLGGFSQGGLMALDVGFRTATPLAGIVVMSGAIYEADLPDLRARASQRVLLLHGADDDVIPVVAAQRTRHVLEGQGIHPEYHEFPMGHHVTPESLQAVTTFIRSCLTSS